MTHSKTTVLAAAMVFSLAAVGCSGGPSPKEVSEASATAAEQTAKGLGGTARSFANSAALKSVLENLGSLQGSFSGVPVSGSGGSVQQQPLTAPEQADLDRQVAELRKFLEEKVFTQDNVESSGGGSTMFLIKGAPVCKFGDLPALPACTDAVDKLQLRIRATSVAPKGLDLTFLFGAAKHEPLTLRLRPDSLTFSLELAQAKLALADAGSLFGLPPTLPRVLEGQVELKLQKNGEEDFTSTLSVVKAVHVEDDRDNGTFAFQTAATAVLWQLHVEGLAHRIGFELNLGPTRVSRPYKGEVSRSGLAGKVLTYDLSGASFAFSAQDGDDNFVVAHVGFGDAQSTVQLDNTVLFTSDLNSLSQRHFDLNLSRDADGQPVVRVLPEVDVVTGFFLQALKVDSDVSVPSYYENETYRVRLTGGGAPAVKPLKADAASGFPGGLKVIAGTLSFETSRPNVAPVVVPAGSCLVERKDPAVDAHPLLGKLEARACP